MPVLTSSVDVKIFVGDNEVISNGVININCNKLLINIMDLNINIIFENDEKDKTARFSGSNDGEKTLKIKIFNMNNALLEGFYTPIEIGNINGRKLYLSLSAWTLDNKNNIRTIAYTIYLAKAV